MSERPTAAAHRVVSEVVKPGDLVVDATAGNGHDTLFLADLVGERGKVVAFDVQQEAVSSTRIRMEDAGLLERVEIRLESHVRLLDRTGPAKVTAVMFNLGYLPGGDHELITRTVESVEAVILGLESLRSGGVMTVVCYTGHPGGEEEAGMVVLALQGLEGKGSFALEIGEPARENAPFLVVVRKG